jgi:hypothetical protein
VIVEINQGYDPYDALDSTCDVEGQRFMLHGLNSSPPLTRF